LRADKVITMKKGAVFWPTLCTAREITKTFWQLCDHQIYQTNGSYINISRSDWVVFCPHHKCHLRHTRCCHQWILPTQTNSACCNHNILGFGIATSCNLSLVVGWLQP